MPITLILLHLCMCVINYKLTSRSIVFVQMRESQIASGLFPLKATQSLVPISMKYCAVIVDKLW